MLKRITFISALFIFCLSTIACKSSYEKAYDKAMDDALKGW